MFADRDRNSDLQGQVMIPFTYRLLDFQGMSTQNGDGRVSQHVEQRSPILCLLGLDLLGVRRIRLIRTNT